MARKTDARTPEKTEALEHVPCAHETCDLEARVRVKTPTGWANMCLPHYERFHEDIALKNCAAKGLLRRPDEDMAQYRKRVMAYLKANARLKTFDDAEDDRGAQALEDEWSRTA